jgi:hypothetical protein
MSKVSDQSPPRSEQVRRWLEDNLAEQERRHAAIAAGMEALTATRQSWIAEFFQRLQTTGYNVAGDQKRRITRAELPVNPGRPFKVTY